jgi:hypothetical protein
MSTLDTLPSATIYPINGAAICALLARSISLDEICEISDIETLCSSDCTGLGVLHQSVVTGGSVRVTVAELVKALQNADQVVGLVIWPIMNPRMRLVIEDGELVENNLPS